MMLVPDVRKASPEAAARAVAACQRMSRRDARRYLYEEFTLDDRRELDDATLEMLGVEDPDERAELRDRLYRTSPICSRPSGSGRSSRWAPPPLQPKSRVLAPGRRRRAVGRARVRPRSAPVPGGVRHPPQRRGALRSAVRGGGGGRRAHRPRGAAEGGHGPGRRTGRRGPGRGERLPGPLPGGPVPVPPLGPGQAAKQRRLRRRRQQLRPVPPGAARPLLPTCPTEDARPAPAAGHSRRAAAQSAAMAKSMSVAVFDLRRVYTCI